VAISGHLTTSGGVAMANQAIFIGSTSVITDATGAFSFANMPLNTPVNVRVSRTTNPVNGVDAVDILLMRRHILGTKPITSKASLFAADVDGSQEIDAVDMLLMRRLILGTRDYLPVASWRFMPAFVLNSPDFPFNTVIPDIFEVTFTAATNNFDFIGVKMGDVDNTADADQ
jgi:hypothetical protein